ncbi:hypothetical protein KAR91_63425 [Candidatus Pacearchaeota archaeon]|nr:hypothetical protein [Candidatus Pacearchaeota archaeon]
MNKLVSIGDASFTINCIKCKSTEVSVETETLGDGSIRGVFLCNKCPNHFVVVLPYFEESKEDSDES